MLSMAVTVAALSGVAAREQPLSPARLFDLTTAHGIDGDKPFGLSSVFGPDDDVVYLWYAAEGWAIGTTIRSVWLYLLRLRHCQLRAFPSRSSLPDPPLLALHG